MRSWRALRRPSSAVVAVAISTALVALVAVIVVPLTSTAGPAAPAAPAQLVIASPAPGSRTASVATQISLLGRAALALKTLSVVGSVSGAHSGHFAPYSQGDGESFLLARPFQPGEKVTVRSGLDIAGAPSGTWSFRIGRRLPVGGHEPLPGLSTTASGVAHFASAPSIEPPVVTVSSGAGDSGGDFFLTPKGSRGEAGPMIVDSRGRLVWFDPLPGEEAFDLNVQRLGRQRVLTWFQGVVSDAHGVGEAVIADDHYQVLYTVQGGNGFAPDLHELQLLPSGVAIVTSYQALHWNLRPAGGTARGLVWDGIVQEIDVRTGLVEYEWHSLDHVGVASSDFTPSPNPKHIFDYFHINSIQHLAGGDLLVGARNTSAVYKVVPADGGSVAWVLGGKHSSFPLGQGARFWYQHDSRLLPGGLVSLFDDEASPARSYQSRGLVLRVGAPGSTATVVHSYTHQPALLGGALGNVQTLPGGDVVISWGTTPWFSQDRASGALVFDAHLPNGDDSYRAYRYHWTGHPLTAPSLAVTTSGAGSQLAMSWNGATGIVRWRVLAGVSASSLHTVAEVADDGFQTTLQLATRWPLVEVEALARGGAVLGTSATVPTAAGTSGSSTSTTVAGTSASSSSSTSSGA